MGPKSPSKKVCQAQPCGNVRYTNLYWKADGTVEGGVATYTNAQSALDNRKPDGTYICTLKLTTKAEVA